MLKKLFVHEWKDSWRLVAIMNLIVVGLTLIGTFFLNNDTWNKMDKNEFMAATVMIYMMFFIASIVALSMVVTFYFYTRFYRNLYTDQGYLMHTLPVTPHQLIWSKTFVALIWTLISTVVMIGSIFSLVFAAIPSEERSDFFYELGEVFRGADFGAKQILVVILYILLIVVAQLMSVFMGYASISIGQTFKKQKILGAIGVYIGIYMLLQMLSSYLSVFLTVSMNPYELESQMGEMNYVLAFMTVMLIGIGALAIVFYFITHHIMKNKLNLE